MPRSVTLPDAATRNAPRLRLDYLDGLRGLTALYVVFVHTYLAWPSASGRLGRVLASALNVFTFGHYAVNVFIVLSGYCLMLPVVRSADGALPGGIGAFLRRRMRRILPPYYATLMFSLLILALDPALSRVDGSGVMPAFTPGILLSHLLLIHNLSRTWEFKINTPMWSISNGVGDLFPVRADPHAGLAAVRYHRHPDGGDAFGTGAPLPVPSSL